MKYWKEIVIAVLVISLTIASGLIAKYKNKANEPAAEKVRMQNISSVTAGRGAVRDRETNLYPTLDKGIADIESQRAKIKAAEQKPSVSRKEVADHVQNETQGNINARAHLFVLAGYSCSVR